MKTLSLYLMQYSDEIKIQAHADKMAINANIDI